MSSGKSLSVFLVASAALAWPAPVHSKTPRGALPTVPDQFKDDDAIILEWEDSVQMGAGGESKWHHKKRVLIQNDRALGAFADPRITYNKDFQTVDVLVARTLCPDGRVVEVPKYSRNEVSPRETAGWPAFGAIRQLVLTFSAIEPGSILELEWETTTKHFDGCQEFEFVVKGPYPILNRRITKNGAIVHEAKAVESLPEEPSGLTPRDRHSIVAISQCGDGKAWAREMLGRFDSVGHVDASVLPLGEWTSSKSDPLDKAAAIQDKLAAQLNVIEAPPPNVPIERRTAEMVWRSHYATPLEAAGLLLACLRDAGLSCEPIFIVSSDSSDLSASAISAYGVAVQTRSGISYWHATQGQIREPGPWGGWRRYDKAFLNSGDAEPARFKLPEDSRLGASIVVTVDEKANYTAKIDLKLSGLFLNSALRTEDEKKSAVNGVLNKLLPDAEISKFTVTSLSDELFAVSAEAKSAKPIQASGGEYFFTLPQEPPWTGRFEFPMGHSHRRTTMRLAGPFEQSISLELKLPEGWSAIAMPKDISHVVGTAASVNQRVGVAKGRVTLTSTTTLSKRDLSPDEYAQLRIALSDLQSLRARTIAISRVAMSARPEKSS